MLELKRISAGYGRHDVLHGVCVSFNKGDFVGIVGRNGSGKSTMLKAIIGIISVSSGEICVDGESISQLTRRERARRIAYLSQSRAVPDMTVLDAVLHGRFPHIGTFGSYTERDRELAFSAVCKVGLSEYADTPLAALSGGMRQNAYVAMALAQDAEYILLDEPTTHLDINRETSLMKMLRSLSQDGRCVVAVIHDLPMALTFCDRIVVVENGEVCAEGTASDDSVIKNAERVLGAKIRCTDGVFYYDINNN